MKLLIAEKPSVAVSSYRPLLEEVEHESFQKRDGFLQGKDWCISWCVGHLVEMAYPAEYGWEKWELDDLPMLPSEWKYNAKKATKDQFDVLMDLMSKADVIVNGADAGREGELIYRLVREMVKNDRAEEKRLWINSFVQKDMVKGWKNIKPGKDYKPLFDAALCRAKSDWLVGMNFSRGYSIKTGVRQISVGRVQTPSLALIVRRDHDVENWKDAVFYELHATWKGVTIIYHLDGKRDLDNHALVDSALQACKGKEGELTHMEENEKKNSPGKPFDLAGLQKAANKVYGFKAQETLDVTQKLYEGKYVTYPRTDSEYLPSSMLDESYQTMTEIASEEEKAVMRMKDESFVFFNSSKVTDHFAIIPTGVIPKELSDKEMKVYNLIRDRFVLAFAKPYRYKQTDLVVMCEGNEFRAALKVVVDMGFKGIGAEEKEDEGEENEQVFTGQLVANVGDRDSMNDLDLIEKKRSKPKYHTEGTLITAMETAGREIDSEELREVLKGQGIGTPATRAGIIELLKRREYISQKGKFLISTAKGRELVNIVDESVSSAEMTGSWEHKLKQVEQGEYAAESFMTEIEEMVKNVSKTFSEKDTEFEKKMQTEENTCPECKGIMRLSDHGAFCKDDEHCGFKIWRTMAKKKLPDGAIIDLVVKGKTKKLKGFTSSKGKKFDAKLKLEDGKVVFDFS
ncbi:type IA DNA topoisomerase [Ekhidna sp.]